MVEGASGNPYLLSCKYGEVLITLQGINISTGHILLTALDHRAATFEKLKQLQPALRDAKDMIELKPGLAKVGSLCFIYVKSMENRVKFDEHPCLIDICVKF